MPDTYPATVGACDAAGSGMDGIYFVPTPKGKIKPLLWRQRFPSWVQQQLVSFSNPDNTINNSDLKLAGSVTHNVILGTTVDVWERMTHNVYDNTVAVFWQQK